MKMKEENKFAAISRPKDIRLNNLQAAKEAVSATKIFYKVENIREKKLELMSELNKEVKELQLLFTKLYDFLPEHEMLEIKKVKAKEIKKKTGKRKTVETKTSNSEKQIDKLEQSLSIIEEKLNKL